MKLILCVLLALLGCATAAIESTPSPTATDKPRKMPCCMPEVFEIGLTGSQYISQNKTTTYRSYSLDFKTQRYVQNVSGIMAGVWDAYSIMSLGNYTYFVDYTRKACDTFPYKTDVDQCIPNDYLYVGTVTVGGTLVVDDFFSHTRFSESSFQVSSKDCIPVRQTETDLYVGGSEEYVYFNATMGIKDQSVFVPPDYCHKVPVQGSMKTHPLFRMFSKLGGFSMF